MPGLLGARGEKKYLKKFFLKYFSKIKILLFKKNFLVSTNSFFFSKKHFFFKNIMFIFKNFIFQIKLFPKQRFSNKRVLL